MKSYKVSKLQVLSTIAGYVIGRLYFDDDVKAWLPFSYESEHIETQHEAEEYLDFMLTFIEDKEFYHLCEDDQLPCQFKTSW